VDFCLCNFYFSSNIFCNFCFLGRTEESMPKLCSIIMRLTPTRSRADHAKTSLLRLRQERSLSSSSGKRSSLTITICLGVMGSRGTVLIPSLLCRCALVFLPLFVRGLLVSSHFVMSKCTLRWPGMKSLSMFLATYWSPYMVIAPWGPGIFMHRYITCIT
jgi:hypothetical protein